MTGALRALAFAVALILAATGADAETYHREELRIEMKDTGPRGLEALLVRPGAPGKYPLAIITHGAPRKPEERTRMTPWTSYQSALEFARRGWAVVVVMRRAYGDSDGAFAEGAGPCEKRDYTAGAKASAQDIRAAITFLAKRPDIDGTRILAVGQSAGGIATVALTADPPPGLIGAISFAGGRGSKSDFVVCDEPSLIGAFRTFGKTSRIPMLWVYTANDHYFAPPLAARFHAAFTAGGGQAKFIKAPPFGKDGHALFSANGIPQWTPYVDAWLTEQKLALREQPMDLPPLPDVKAPPQLNDIGREAFGKYLRAGQHKAFAVTKEGGFGYQTARRSLEEAKAEALRLCIGDKARDCRLVFIGDQPAP